MLYELIEDFKNENGILYFHISSTNSTDAGIFWSLDDKDGNQKIICKKETNGASSMVSNIEGELKNTILTNFESLIENFNYEYNVSINETINEMMNLELSINDLEIIISLVLPLDDMLEIYNSLKAFKRK